MTTYLKRISQSRQFVGRAPSRPLLVALVIAANISVLPAPAFAELEEIIVSAQRRAQTVQEIPYNISAFTGEDLEAARAFSLADVERLVPGLSYKDQGGALRSSRNTFILRGLNANDGRLIFGTDVSSGAVSMYFGETPLFFPMVMKDIERVEVLRGPQGTLYGSGSLGGTIRFIPEKASFEGFAMDLNLNLDSISESDDLSYGGDIMLNIPLVDDTLALRVVASLEDKAGFVDAVGLVASDASGIPIGSVPGDPTSGYVLAPEEDTNSSEAQMLRLNLNWAPSDTFSGQLTYVRQKTEVDDFTAVNPGFEGGLVDSSLGQFPGSLYPNPNGCTDGVAYSRYFLADQACQGAGGLTLYPNSGVTIPDAGDYDHSSLTKSPGESTVDLYNLDLTFDLGFAQLSSSTSYSDVSFENEPDFTGFDLPVRSPGGSSVATFNGFYPRAIGRTTSTDDTERFTQEFRFVSNGDGAFDYVVGVYYEDRDSHGVTHTVQPGLSAFDLNVNSQTFFFAIGQNQTTLPDVTFAEDRSFSFEDMAVFGELSYHISDQWQITGGVRVFRQEFEHEFESLIPFCGTFCSSPEQPRFTEGGTTITDVKRSFNDQIFKVNTSYNINDDTMVYFTWSEGFRHGGTNALPTGGRQASLPGLLGFEPDEVTNWEIGLKGSLLENLNYSLAAYVIDWENFQFESFVTAGFKTVLNGDEARTQGLELELNGVLGDRFFYNIGYSYVDAEVSKDFAKQDYVAGDASDIVDIISVSDGDSLPSVPENTLTVAVDYDQRLSNDWTITYHLDGKYASDAQSTFNEGINFGRDFFKIDSYSVFNASINLKTNKNWSASLYVRNIGDEQNFSGGNTAAAAGAVHQYYFSMTPRTIGLAFNYRM